MDAIIKRFQRAQKKTSPEEGRPSREEAEQAVHTLIRWAGDNPAREGLVNTPRRVVKAYEEFFAGYDQKAGEALSTTFEEVEGYDDIIMVKNIDLESHCEHHMVPIIGRAHIAYLPDGQVVGLSKLARLIDVFAKRLQTQEAMTAQIADALYDYLAPLGVAVRIEAAHHCMTMRGVKRRTSETITTQYRGAFLEDPQLEMRFLSLLASGEQG